MKKTLLLMLAFFTLATAGLKAQSPFGQSYLKVQFYQPTGEYKDFYNAGFGAESGRMFPLFVVEPEYNLQTGLDITFLYTSFNFGKEHVYFQKGDLMDGLALPKDLQTEGGLLWDLGVKIGPMVSMDVVQDLTVDLSFQYAPTICFSFRKGPKEDDVMQSFDSQKSSASVSFAHRFSFKGDIRYQHFIFGLEYMFGSTTVHYANAIIPAQTKQNSGIPSYKPTKERDLGLGTLVLGIGLTF
ncbi:MAG: hypothetical protein IJ748_06540 [Bacteroidales bacterium]|nr:hypothetical protein [Bacteroidales bacterium]